MTGVDVVNTTLPSGVILTTGNTDPKSVNVPKDGTGMAYGPDFVTGRQLKSKAGGDQLPRFERVVLPYITTEVELIATKLNPANSATVNAGAKDWCA